MQNDVTYEGIQRSDGRWIFQVPLASRVARFRDERIAAILADETPLRLPSGPKVVIHLLPQAAFTYDGQVGLVRLPAGEAELRPLYGHGWNGRINFDGYLTYAPGREPGSAEAYLQFFHTGVVETVTARLIDDDPQRRVIAGLTFEQEIIESVSRYLKQAEALGIEPPLSVCISLLGIRGYQMAPDSNRYLGRAREAIDRDHLLIPPVVAEDLTSEPATLLFPAFNRIWQAAGWKMSHYYDEHGRRLAQYR